MKIQILKSSNMELLSWKSYNKFMQKFPSINDNDHSKILSLEL